MFSMMTMLVTTPAIVGAADDHWQVGTVSSFSSGKYGTDTRTEVLHTPITARRLFDAGDLTLVFPFTCIWGNGVVTLVDGSPVRKEVTGTTAPTSDPTTQRAASTGTTGRTTNTSTTVRTTSDLNLRPGTGALLDKVTVCGMGDIVVRGRYFLLDERAFLPTIAVRAHVKTPTASAERGLGTGKSDEGVGLEISRTLPGGLMTMVDGGYTVIGKPAGVDFNNNWWYDIGLGQSLANGAVNFSVFFEEYRAIVPGLANAQEVLAALTVKGASGWRLQVTGQLGLSDGAPDHGITFGASRRF
jgi:hypothetical protein